LARLAHGDPYAHSHGVAAVFHQFDVPFQRGQFDRARSSEQFGEIDFQAAGTFSRRARDGRRLVFGKTDGVLMADAAAGGTPPIAVILVLGQDSLLAVYAVYAEEAKVDAF